MSLIPEKQEFEEQEAIREEVERNLIARQTLRFIALSLSIGLAVYIVIRWLQKSSEQQNRLAGDSTTDAPLPKGKQKKKGKGK
jgi:hypothetical protein